MNQKWIDKVLLLPAQVKLWLKISLGVFSKDLQIRKKKERVSSRYLVFTSAGDRSSVDAWVQGRRDFDLWITYYGDQPGRYSGLCEFYNAHKGGKFPNLHYAYQKWPEIFAAYDAVMVMDDDVIISTQDINKMFQVRERYDLWICQPAFLRTGRVSHEITVAQEGKFLRFTNYVEMTCPLFWRRKLDDFMKVYDPVLVGHGCDLWFLDVIRQDQREKVAVVDAIRCVNPSDHSKGPGGREIVRLQSDEQRRKIWKSIRERFQIQGNVFDLKEFGSVILGEERQV
ncbi:MAG: hypothetical protein HQL21_08885 [Candidatus Omnitrophica bacterium]|nr:hypothetical protein [Candidatus Omnitrophota bacterium]